MPGAQHGRPATTMLSGLFDAGASEPSLTLLDGHSVAVYEPDARLSLVWPVPETDERDEIEQRRRLEYVPDWAKNDEHQWKHATDGWVVVLHGGAPIWQERVWYLDWGSGIGGYVADFQPRFGGPPGGTPTIEGWEASAWSIGLARLLNSFSSDTDFASLEPTARLVPNPSPRHPIDAQREDTGVA